MHIDENKNGVRKEWESQKLAQMKFDPYSTDSYYFRCRRTLLEIFAEDPDYRTPFI